MMTVKEFHDWATEIISLIVFAAVTYNSIRSHMNGKAINKIQENTDGFVAKIEAAAEQRGALTAGVATAGIVTAAVEASAAAVAEAKPAAKKGFDLELK